MLICVSEREATIYHRLYDSHIYLRKRGKEALLFGWASSSPFTCRNYWLRHHPIFPLSSSFWASAKIWYALFLRLRLCQRRVVDKLASNFNVNIRNVKTCLHQRSTARNLRRPSLPAPHAVCLSLAALCSSLPPHSFKCLLIMLAWAGWGNFFVRLLLCFALLYF